MFPHEAQAKADEIFEGKFAPGYKRTYWEGCTHGFTVRGDMVSAICTMSALCLLTPLQSDPKVKAGKEGAFTANVEFLIAHL